MPSDRLRELIRQGLRNADKVLREMPQEERDYMPCSEWDIAEQEVLKALTEQPDATAPEPACSRCGRAASGEQPASSNGKWIVVCDDPDRNILFFEGNGAEEAARKAHKQMCQNWTCELFVSAGDLRYAAPAAPPAQVSEEQANAIQVQIARLCSYGCACDLRNGYVCGIHKLGDEVKTNVIALLRSPASTSGKEPL